MPRENNSYRNLKASWIKGNQDPNVSPKVCEDCGTPGYAKEQDKNLLSGHRRKLKAKVLSLGRDGRIQQYLLYYCQNKEACGKHLRKVMEANE